MMDVSETINSMRILVLDRLEENPPSPKLSTVKVNEAVQTKYCNEYSE